MSGDGDGDDLTSNLFGVTTYEAPAAPKRDFRAWHRPRKQFVRETQWCEQIARLLDDSPELAAKGRALRYCGLPGPDLIDIRCFHEQICAVRELGLLFLGFNSAAGTPGEQQTDLITSLDEVQKLPGVDPLSEVIPDDVRKVASEDSVAWDRVLGLGPFDVINLDLCDGFGKEASEEFDANYYNAVVQLMTIQARQKTPWLLLLTTRVGSEHVDGGTLEVLRQLYSENLAGCEEFKFESNNAFQIHDDETLTKALGTELGLQRVFVTGICKWLLGLAVSQNPPSVVAVRSVLGYRVAKGAKAEDLVSVAIRVTPHHYAIPDPAKIAAATTKKPDECLLAAKALKRVAKLADVDDILKKDAALNDAMQNKMKSLLGAARYDMDVYPAWVAAEKV